MSAPLCLVAAIALGPAAWEAPSLLRVNGMAIELQIGPGAPNLDQRALVRWVEEAARDVTEYLGEAPVPRVGLRIPTDSGGRIGSGRMFGGEGEALIRVSVGRRSTERDLARDWVLTHEMFHLVLPDLPDEQAWLEEGLATYLEPVARVRRGRMAAGEMWRGLVEGVPKGLPHAGAPGLDASPSWGSTYWGGALFWLLADIEIRERSASRRALADALRAVLLAGGNGTTRWTTERLLASADAGTGVPVLHDLYMKMGRQPLRPDLEDLWRRLGVSPTGDGLEDAPLAALRRAITAPQPSRPTVG